MSDTQKEVGAKHDQGKIRMDLLPWDALTEIGRVLTHGAEKYTDDGWRKVDNGFQRYEAAMLRHLAAYKNGEVVDKESQIHHLAHLACNALFMLALKPVHIWVDKNDIVDFMKEYAKIYRVAPIKTNWENEDRAELLRGLGKIQHPKSEETTVEDTFTKLDPSKAAIPVTQPKIDYIKIESGDLIEIDEDGVVRKVYVNNNGKHDDPLDSGSLRRSE